MKRNDKRNEVATVYLTPEQRAKIEEKAGAIPLSVFMRCKALGQDLPEVEPPKRVSVRLSIEEWNELHEQGDGDVPGYILRKALGR